MLVRWGQPFPVVANEIDLLVVGTTGDCIAFDCVKPLVVNGDQIFQCWHIL